MDIDSMLVGDLRKILASTGPSKAVERHPYEVGMNYFIRTATHYYTGKLVQVTRQELVLEDACWIADTGRFNKALKDGVFSETEPFPVGRVIVGRGAVVDASIWQAELPRSEK